MASAVNSSIKYWWVFLLRGFLFIILGIYMFTAPGRSYMALSLLFGAIILVAGVAELIHAYGNRHGSGWGWRLFAGIIDLILGIILVSNIEVSMRVLPFVMGIWFLFRAVSLFTFATVVRPSLWVIIGGILTTLFALLVMFNPVFGAMTIVVWTAIAFIIAGIFNLVLGFRLKATNDLFTKSL